MSEDDEIGQATRETEQRSWESKSIKTVRDAAAVVLPENVTSSDFIFAVGYLQELVGKELTEDQDTVSISATPYDAVRALCNPLSGPDFLKHALEALHNDSRQNLPKDQIYQQLVELAELSKRVIGAESAKTLASKFSAHEDDDHLSASEAVDKIRNFQFTVIEHAGPFNNDTISIFYPDGQEFTEKTDKASKAFLEVWNAVRCTNEPRECRILLIAIDGGSVQPETEMEMNPDVVIDLNQPHYESVVAHEAVHAVFGEAGFPYSNDFFEGCAVRLEFAFQRDGHAGLPDRDLLHYLKNYVRDREGVTSSTSILQSEDAPDDDWSRDTMEYVFGYVLIDTLLKNQRYRSLSQERSDDTHRPYQLLMDLNRAMAEYPVDRVDTIDPTKVFVRGLKQVGFTDQDIAQLFRELKVAFNELPTVIQGIHLSEIDLDLFS